MKKALKRVLKVGIILFVLGVLSFVLYCCAIASTVKLNENVMHQPKITLEIYDKNNEKINLCGYKDNLTFENIPKALIDAFVCIEDRKFFEHNGVDVDRMAKALVKNIISMSNKEGASTITQQFIKNTHLSIDKTLNRKVKEIKLALELEKKYSKEEIITAYFNVLYFGNSIYGVKNASQTFFGKNCEDLSVSECALLAGIVKNPASYSPIRNLENAKSRRNFVLNKMFEQGYISQDLCENSKNEEILLNKTNKATNNAFMDCVIDECVKILNINEKDLAYSQYKIYTKFDPILQSKVENLLQNESSLAKRVSGKSSDAYCLVTDNNSGLVSAYYNSLNVDINEFRRQPGSVIKPFVSYLPCLSSGIIHPVSPVLDQKKSFGGYSPSNFGDKYIGWTTARNALSKSINTVAVELMNNFGVENAIEYAKKFGLTFNEQDYTLATALGGMTDGVTPIEITSAYMTLANQGAYKRASFVSKIESRDGKVLYDSSDILQSQVENIETVYLLTDMLVDCAKNGTASRLGVKKRNVASKTGTVGLKNGLNNDIWNLSYTNRNTICVWMGNADGGSDALSKTALASVYPTGVVKEILDELDVNGLVNDFEIPENIVEMPYSKRYFDNEHLLVSPDEFSLSSEVSYDIFNKRVLLPKNDMENLYTDPIKNFDVKFCGDGVKISFDADKDVNYSVYRTGLFEEWCEVCRFDNQGEKCEFIDKKITYGNDYVYKIEAYVINYKNEIKYLGKSEEKFVVLPFDLWA